MKNRKLKPPDLFCGFLYRATECFMRKFCIFYLLFSFFSILYVLLHWK